MVLESSASNPAIKEKQVQGLEALVLNVYFMDSGFHITSPKEPH